MREASLDEVYKLAKQDERVVFIGSDLRGRHAACEQGRRRPTGRHGLIPTLH